jgi:uncharacterized integral membrane protein (TIGR00698 family)
MTKRDDSDTITTVPPLAPTNWAIWLVPAALIPLIVWGNPLSAILVGAGISLSLNRSVIANASHYGKLALQTAIVLLGANLDAASMWQMSQDYAGLTALYVLITLGAGLLLGRLLKIDQILNRLIAAGTAICGGTAIATLSPILKARADQLALALTIVFCLNMVAILTFPVVGNWLDMTETQFGVWAALAVHDTSSVMATAAVYGDHATEVATTVKLGRTLWLIPITLAFSLFSGVGGAKIRIPGFIALFILASILGSVAKAYAVLPPILFDGIKFASQALIVVALFFIGLEFTRETFRNLRGRVVSYALLLWATVVPLTLWVALRFG